ncbi:MAG: ATP-binding protein, partial [bacterium]|nr:ATP-binding protein [bacterium]
MRRFSSYGPINTKLHYYASREELIRKAYTRLVGENPEEGGHCITVWAPRQCGKTWIMLEIFEQIEKTGQFDVVKVDLEHLIDDTDVNVIATAIADDIFIELGKENPGIDTLKKFQELFTRSVLEKPVILILDEFDALNEEAINKLTHVFRNIYLRRQKELKKPMEERRYLLHGLALIGVRSVLGIENVKG